MSSLFSSPKKRSAWLMLVLILLATWIRLWRFPDIPPAFNYDEAYNLVDALWLWETGSQTAFLPGNTGRHALFHYLAIPFLALFGVNTFALRFLSVVIGLVTIPLLYRWIQTMFAPKPERFYMALIASAGLTFSFWYIAISRSGFRASLLLLLYVLMAHLFWRGWQRRSIGFIIGAGVVLGLCQYTYWSAALLPLQFGLFALIWSVWRLRQHPAIQSFQAYSIGQVWLWVGLMAAASLIVFVPLGLQYIKTPLVLQYIGQSSILDRITTDGRVTWPNHLLNSVRIFMDGPEGLWRGEIYRIIRFDWLALLGFWIGLIVAIVRRHQPAYLFLLTGLIVLWLPVPLNDIDFVDLRVPDMLPVHHAISNLRAAGLLPIYYAIVAVGLMAAAQWLRQRTTLIKPAAVGLITFICILGFSGGLNVYNFFVRWPRQPLLYERYNGPIFDLAQELVRQSEDKDILLPFHLYAHPTMHLFLDKIFSESEIPPAESHRSTLLVTASNAPFTSYMWLVRSENGPGTAYLTPPQETERLLSPSARQPLETYHLAAPLMFTAQTTLVSDIEELRPLLTNWTVPNPVDYAWNDEVRLVGYRVTPNWVQPGQAVNLTLYWQNLADQPLTHDVFIHAINGQGHGVGQVDNVMLGDGHRWRIGKLTPSHHTLWLDNQLSPGPYLIRLGLFNTRSGKRIPIAGAAGENLGDQVLLGLFYVTDNDQDPLRPAASVQATLGTHFELLGYNLPQEQSAHLATHHTTISPETYWRATDPVAENYTIFVQLLDSQDQLISGYDTQPLAGHYPTSLWQTGEVFIHRVELNLPSQVEPGNYRLVTGMYDLQSGERLEAKDKTGQPLENNMVTVFNVIVSSNEVTFLKP